MRNSEVVAAEILFDPFTTLQPMIGPLAYLMLTGGVIVCLVQLMLLISTGRPDERLPKVGGGLVLIVVGSGLHALPSSAADPDSTEPPAATPAGVPAPTMDRTGGIDPTAVIAIVIAGCGVAAALGALAIGILVLRRRARDRREGRSARQLDWATAHALYTGVLDDYSAYLADPYAWLDRPVLDDLADPATAAFLDALADAQTLDLDVVPVDQRRIDAFRAAAQDLRRAWDTADENARRIGTTGYTDDSRIKLRKAAGALRIALDGTAPADERAAAADAVRRLTDGLVTAPERILGTVTAEITAARRKELPVGPTR